MWPVMLGTLPRPGASTHLENIRVRTRHFGFAVKCPICPPLRGMSRQQCCSFCRKPGHNRLTCVRKHEELVEKLREELAAAANRLAIVRQKEADLQQRNSTTTTTKETSKDDLKGDGDYSDDDGGFDVVQGEA